MGTEPSPRPGPPRGAVVLLGVLVAGTFGAGVAGVFVVGDGPSGPPTPEAALRGYYAGLRAEDCERAASFVDPAFLTVDDLCEGFDDTLELSGRLVGVVERAVEGDRATLVFEREVDGVADRRIARVRRGAEGWRLAGGSSCYPALHPEDLGGDHLAEGEELDGYSSSPPTSGPHAPVPARTGVIYEEPQPLAPLVHAMEHGAVVFWVGAVEPAFRERAATIVTAVAQQGYHALVLTPFPEMDVPFAMTAWGTLQRCIGLDPLEIAGFVDAFYGSGLEGALACEEPAAALPACRA